MNDFLAKTFVLKKTFQKLIKKIVFAMQCHAMNMFLLFIFCLVNNTLNIFFICLYQHRYTVMRIKPNSSLTVIIRLILFGGLIILSYLHM